MFQHVFIAPLALLPREHIHRFDLLRGSNFRRSISQDASRRLEKPVAEERERLKNEMLGKVRINAQLPPRPSRCSAYKPSWSQPLRYARVSEPRRPSTVATKCSGSCFVRIPRVIAPPPRFARL